MIAIRQKDGTVSRFAPSALSEAFSTTARQLYGEPVEPHPLSEAADNSPDSQWAGSFYSTPEAARDPGGDLSDLEDLSEK